MMKLVSKWAFRLYIIWSIVADITLLAGIMYLIFFWWARNRIDGRCREVETAGWSRI